MIIALFAAIGVVTTAVTGVSAVWTMVAANQTTPPLEPDRQLTLAETPVPGEESMTLGYGDADGGRRVVPYVINTPTPASPYFNSFVDLQYNNTNELMYMRVLISDDLKHEFGDRSARAKMDDTVWVRIYVHNNASPVADCEKPEGSAVAVNTRVRLVVSTSSDGQLTVIRSWITADNANPQWITDAVAVELPSNVSIAFEPAKSTYYTQSPEQPDGPVPVTDQIVHSGGFPIGVDGQMGSCWENRIYMLLAFEVIQT